MTMMSVMSRYCILQLLMLAVTRVRCEVHVVQWSVKGVEPYREQPLVVKLSDSLPEPDRLVLTCLPGSYSNVVAQSTQEQFDNCDTTVTSSTGEARSMKIGECLGITSNLSFLVTGNSGGLESAFDFRVGETVYLTSYSNGSSVEEALNNVTMGGECERGLKLAINVVDPQATTTASTTVPPATAAPTETTSQSSPSTSAGTTAPASTGTSTSAATAASRGETTQPPLPPASLGVNTAPALPAFLATTTTALLCTAIALVLK